MSNSRAKQKSTVVSPRETILAIQQSIVRPLAGATHPAQRRQSHDLLHLLKLQEGPWQGRLAVQRVEPGDRGSIKVRLQLQAGGIIWNSGPQAQSVFDLALLIRATYPLSPPLAIFAGPAIPFHGNVYQSDFAPDQRGMPAELQQVLRDGSEGVCCFLLASQWTARRDHNLSTVLRQISRLLVGAKIHGEQYALNPKARDYYLELKQNGRLPLGPALPLPWDDSATQSGQPIEDAADDAAEAIAWLDNDS